MLRAVRFAAKLGFTIAPDTAAPIRDLAAHLADVPAARLFDEVLKLFQSGNALKSFELLVEFDLFRYLFPPTAELLERPDAETAAAFVRRGLADTDARVAEDKPITPMFLYAVFLWPPITRLAGLLQEREGRTEFEAMQEAIHRVMAEQIARTSLPRRYGTPMKEMLMMQRRFNQRRGARAARLLEHKRFRAGYDFLLLRSHVGEVEAEVAAWWTEIQGSAPAERQEAFDVKRRRSRSRRGRRRSRTGDKPTVPHQPES